VSRFGKWLYKFSARLFYLINRVLITRFQFVEKTEVKETRGLLRKRLGCRILISYARVCVVAVYYCFGY